MDVIISQQDNGQWEYRLPDGTTSGGYADYRAAESAWQTLFLDVARGDATNDAISAAIASGEDSIVSQR
jgi:hypothetical protein